MSVRPVSANALEVQSEASSTQRPLRFVSAASLFDGHDAAINMIRRLLQSHGAEVIHLGHNRSVADIVRAAIQEDADAVAVSSYQGGHNEYFAYMVDMLREKGVEHIRVVVGGGGTIAPREIETLRALRRREDLHAGGRTSLGPRRHDRRCVRARAPRAARPRTRSVRSMPAIMVQLARAISVLEEAQSGNGNAEPIRRAHGEGEAPRAGRRSHRHGRRRQVESERRAAAALRAQFPGPPDRGGRDGSDAPPLGRRAAGRSHSHECARGREHLHALARHAPPEPRDQRGARRTRSACCSSQASI